MPFCPQCGSAVEGKFCAKCGAQMDFAPAGAPGGPLPPSAGTGMTDNVAACLCYIPIIAVIFLLIEPYNRNKTVRFHAFQSIFLFVGLFVLFVGLGVVGIILGMISFWLGSLWGLVNLLLSLASLLLWVYMLVKTYQNERIVLPVVGPLAEKQA